MTHSNLPLLPLLSPRPLADVLSDFDASLPLSEAFTIPGSWYTDPRVWDLEKRTVFTRTWQVVARASQVERPGQYVTAQIGDEPIVVVRGTDGTLRAFFNVCRHHAAAVMTEPEGCAERLRCPYHGWTYSLEGELKSLTSSATSATSIREERPRPGSRRDLGVVRLRLPRPRRPLARDLGALPAQIAPLQPRGAPLRRAARVRARLQLEGVRR